MEGSEVALRCGLPPAPCARSAFHISKHTKHTTASRQAPRTWFVTGYLSNPADPRTCLSNFKVALGTAGASFVWIWACDAAVSVYSRARRAVRTAWSTTRLQANLKRGVIALRWPVADT